MKEKKRLSQSKAKANVTASSEISKHQANILFTWKKYFKNLGIITHKLELKEEPLAEKIKRSPNEQH